MLSRHSELLNVIGERIRKTRSARGVSMKIAHDIRAKYGVKLDPSYLSRIERGKTEIPLRTLLAISDYFGIKPAYLIEHSSTDSPTGTEYVFMDPQLVQLLIRLREALGEELAREHLQDTLKDILKLLDQINAGNKRVKVTAARPLTSDGDKTSESGEPEPAEQGSQTQTVESEREGAS